MLRMAWEKRTLSTIFANFSFFSCVSFFSERSLFFLFVGVEAAEHSKPTDTAPIMIGLMMNVIVKVDAFTSQ